MLLVTFANHDWLSVEYKGCEKHLCRSNLIFLEASFHGFYAFILKICTIQVVFFNLFFKV